MQKIRALLIVCLLTSCDFTTRPARAFTYSLASQPEFGNKRGFKLMLEDKNPLKPMPLQNGQLRLILGVADGKTWRFPGVSADWQTGHDYHVKAIIGAKSAAMWLDGKPVVESAGAFLPSDKLQALKAGIDVRGAANDTQYLVQQSALHLETSRGQTFNGNFTPPDQWPLPLFAFEPQTPINAPFQLAPDETLTIEATFRLLPFDLNANAPYVDRFGQSLHAQWPQKITSEADLKTAMADEKQRAQKWGAPPGYDAYGGALDAGWHETPSGFFRTVQRNGFWWLISPSGNPCFYLGVDSVTGTFAKTPVKGRENLFAELPPRAGEFAEAWGNSDSFGFYTANLIRKYGADWEKQSWQQAQQRLKTWGFSGMGKWSGINTPQNGPARLPVQPVIRRTGVPTIGRMPDIFDARVRAALRATIEKTIAPQKENPLVLGWSLGNEHEEIVLKSDISTILKHDGELPAKRALLDSARQQIYHNDAARLAAAWKIDAAAVTAAQLDKAQIPAADIETLRRYFEDSYYDFVYRTVKEIDPNHLYFGFWIGLGWWEDDEDWSIMARHCDVIGYDAYGYRFADERLIPLLERVNKPALCGEFSYPSWYNGLRGLGAYGTATPDDATSGAYYARWIHDAARNPYVVGAEWFQYHDQHITGRDAAPTPALAQGEHFAFGLVDITDQPKWEMIAPMREANLSAVTTRLQATKDAATKDAATKP